MKHLLAAIFKFIVLCSHTYAENDSLVLTSRVQTITKPFAVQVLAGIAFNKAAFRNIPDVQSCCIDYSADIGASFSSEASYKLAPIGKLINLNTFIGLSTTSSYMSTVTQEIVDFRGDAVLAEIQHDLDMSLIMSYFGFKTETCISNSINAVVGVGASIPLRYSYTIRENLLSPDNIRFETGRRVRNERSGRSSAATSAFFVPISLEGPRYRLTHNLEIAPVIATQQWITSVNSSIQWRLSSLQLGMKLSWFSNTITQDTQIVSRNKSPIATSSVKDTNTPPQRITIAVGIRDSATHEISENSLITYNVTNRRLAVLQAIVFDSASTEIPLRFQRKLDFDKEENKDKITDLDLSHSILHLVGKSLQSQTMSRILIKASHSKDVPIDGQTELAQGRAESVKKYLTSEYQIDPARIRTVLRAFPEQPSSTNTVTGRAENRRVDFELIDGVYALPIQSDTFTVKSPDIVNGQLLISRPSTVKKLDIFLQADSMVLSSRSVTSFSDKIDVAFVLTENDKRAMIRSRNINLRVALVDSIDGVVERRSSSVPILVQHEDQLLDEYGIVLFNYNSSRIAESEQKCINEMIRLVPKAKTIDIKGTADNSGSEDVNLRLATQRAKSVAAAMGLKEGTYKIQGKILYDSSLIYPESRILSRQVKVLLKSSK